MLSRWCDAAAIRREQIESGADITFSEVFLPYYTKILSALAPRRLLEVGCGTGHMAKALSGYAKHVSAIEPSAGMFDIAREVLSGTDVHLFRSSIEEFREFEKYDVILSHLCAHTIEDIGAFFVSVRFLMNENSFFVFSIPHPCFWNGYKKFIPDAQYSYMKAHSTEANLTITKEPTRVVGRVPYVHRPLSSYFQEIGLSGLAVTDFDEIFPEENVQRLYGSLWEEPRYAVFICRPYS